MTQSIKQKAARAPDDAGDTIQGEGMQGKDIKEILAANIVRYRQKLGLSRATLAQKIGITEAAIGQYERGTRTPQIDIICKIADALNVSVDVLTGHAASEYDAVKEFRFEQAVNFVQEKGYLLFETPEGLIRICEYNDRQLQTFQTVNGIVSAKENQSKFPVLIEFSDRQSFISFIEYFIGYMLTPAVCQEVFHDFMHATTNGWGYTPNLKMKYSGNLETDPYANI